MQEVRMADSVRGLNREEMTSALKRKGQRVVPLKWDDFSDRYMHTHGERLTRLYEKWGTDYVQVAPGYRNLPVGETATQSEYARMRGDNLRGFSPGYSDYVDEWGCLWKTTDADEVGGNCVDHPYHTVEEVLKAPIPEPELPGRLDPIRKSREEHPEDFIWVQQWLGPWETSRAMLGTEETLVALYTERPQLEKFFCRVFEHFQVLLRGVCTLDVDMVGIGDDWGIERSLLIDPDLWVKVFKPLYRTIFEEIRRAEKISLFHSCGCAAVLYPHFIDIGVDVINPLQPGPVDIDKVGREYRGKVTFSGGIDTRRLLEKGTPAEVEKKVIHLIETLGLPEGGLVVGHCTSVHSGTPIENIEAMFQATRTFDRR
jgi:uroporphyrinogen decarboxylase